MKQSKCKIFVVLLMLLFTLGVGQSVYAALPAETSRAIAIVFDNSGSMYSEGDQAWCRATYAMEVFASMLNAGDQLQIYPMHPIIVGDREYTMEDPFCVTDASQSSMIRDIFTPNASGTPIESVDCAIEGIKELRADKKYLIVLTDGDAFWKGGREISASQTVKELDTRFSEHAGADVTIMYLGIGDKVVMPETEQSEFFVKNQAKNSEDVLAALTEMCNQIFGRDTLPRNHISGENMDFDMSMKKVIVFVQGENVSNLKITGITGTTGQLLGSTSTRYGTAGSGRHESIPDTSLQGMMVTYKDCTAGSYTIDYSGTASSVEVYYEPDADLDFIFTDAVGNIVDPDQLYEGDYKVSFGMKDGRTGELIASDLLGNPRYQGYYSVNGVQTAITHDGHSGEVPVKLNMGDVFDARLTVTYLSGYTITKDSSDFGWEEGGIQVSARPAGELKLDIQGGDTVYFLQQLENGSPYIAKVYYEGELLTGEALESVDLKWEPQTSNAEIKEYFAGDHYELSLHYKDSQIPQDTACGECTVDIHAFYTVKGSDEAQTLSPLTYNIEDDFAPLQLDLYAPQDYIVISEMEQSQAMVLNLSVNGTKLTEEEMEAVEITVDCGGIAYEAIADVNNSLYQIKLLHSENVKEGEYVIRIKALYTDHVGRETAAEDTVTLTLSNTPLWVKRMMQLIALLILTLIILAILHIKVLPSKAHVTKRDSNMIFDGEDETKSSTFDAKIAKKQMNVNCKFAGTKTGLVMDVKPGKDSYLRKNQARRSAEVKSASVRKYGNATIQEASIGSIRYILNEENGKLERVPKSDKPFTLRHGMTVKYSGTMMNAGMQKPFSVTTKLNFKKK